MWRKVANDLKVKIKLLEWRNLKQICSVFAMLNYLKHTNIK